MNYQKGFMVGKVTTNHRQVKKHYIQMTNDEKIIVKGIAKEYLGNGKLTISEHLQRKMCNGVVNVQNKSINLFREKMNFDVIEFSKLPTEFRTNYRVLIRARYNEDVLCGNGVTEKCNLCLVLDLTSDTIVTAYWNKISDNHSTVNMNKYNKNIDIIKHLLG